MPNCSSPISAAWSASGTIGRLSQTPQFHLQLRSSDFSPGGFYDFFLLETFKHQYPALERVALGGRMTFQVQLDGGRRRLPQQESFRSRPESCAPSRIIGNWDRSRWICHSKSLSPMARPNSAGAPRAGTLSIAGARYRQANTAADRDDALSIRQRPAISSTASRRHLRRRNRCHRPRLARCHPLSETTVASRPN